MRDLRLWSAWSGSIVSLACLVVAGAGDLRAEERPGAAKSRPTVLGEELFRREWIVDDPRSHGGDGLGPVFNDTSCIACHNQGGAGGAGPSAKNVDLLSAVAAAVPQPVRFQPALANEPEQATEEVNTPKVPTAVVVPPSVTEQLGRAAIHFLMLRLPRREDPQLRKALREAMTKHHPGFKASRTVVLHQFATDPDYDKWRLKTRFGHDFSNEAGGPIVAAPFATTTESELQAPDVEVATAAPVALEVASFPTAAVSLRATRAFFQPGLPMTRQGVLDGLLHAIDFLLVPAEDELSLLSASLSPDGLVDPAIREIIEKKQLAGMERASFASLSVEVPAGVEAKGPAGEDILIAPAGLSFVTSQRNPTAIFGAGRIDSIPDAAIEAAAQRRHPDFPLVQGRVSRLADGRVGRFGWKGQIATLHDFTLTACAVEVGLHVPERPQAPLPHKPEAAGAPAGFDMSAEECDALVRYLRELPAPAAKRADHPRIAEYLAAGRELFEQVGCAVCHVSKLGDVEGVYSDLLLHDLGEDLSDNGTSYGGSLPESIDLTDAAETIAKDETGDARARRPVPAKAREWRTPPLWGVADSAPYLHDGRASTLETAIVLHGGEAARSNILFHKLKPTQRQQVIAFLKTLGTPRE